jgi:hypothetical protein
MLARYGVGYICEHPDILFSTDPALPEKPGQRLYGDAWPADRGYSSEQPYGVPRLEQLPEETLLERLNEAYRILYEVYARHRHGGR